MRLQQTIGLMVLALGFTLVLMLLNTLGLANAFAAEQTFVTRLSLNETLLNGVLCFMLFAGSINVKMRTLGEEKWVILTLAIGATLIGVVLIGLAIWWLLGLLGVGIGLIFALVFGALISPTDPIAALAILGKVGLPPRLEAIVNGESLFNLESAVGRLPGYVPGGVWQGTTRRNSRLLQRVVTPPGAVRCVRWVA